MQNVEGSRPFRRFWAPPPTADRVIARDDVGSALWDRHGVEEALAELRRCAWTQYDPEVVIALQRGARTPRADRLISARFAPNPASQ
jgi:hypothetical protein